LVDGHNAYDGSNKAEDYVGDDAGGHRDRRGRRGRNRSIARRHVHNAGKKDYQTRVEWRKWKGRIFQDRGRKEQYFTSALSLVVYLDGFLPSSDGVVRLLT